MRQFRDDFPILQQQVNGKPLVYLDNAATSQKPIQVLDAMDAYYRQYNANVHRGIHTLSEQATTAYEDARVKVGRFINAPSPTEIIYTRNTTEAINLVAYGWGRKFLKAGDAVVITEMEHHSNIVPWHILRQQIPIDLRFIPVSEDGQLDLTNLGRLLDGAKLVSLMHVSNVLGTINPVAEITRAAHAAGSLVLIDGAQSAPNMPIDVQALGCDFFAFSSHKMCGPTGIGILWGRAPVLDAMDPMLGGGDMIYEVRYSGTTYAALPHKFEAGTPAIAEAIGLGAAVDYLSSIGMTTIAQYEAELSTQAVEALSQIEGLHIFGQALPRGSAVAFTVDGIHPHDLSTILDQEGVAIRAGHHCAQPLHTKFGLPSTARASFYFYNVSEEIQILVKALTKAQEIFGYVAR